MRYIEHRMALQPKPSFFAAHIVLLNFCCSLFASCSMLLISRYLIQAFICLFDLDRGCFAIWRPQSSKKWETLCHKKVWDNLGEFPPKFVPGRRVIWILVKLYSGLCLHFSAIDKYGQKSIYSKSEHLVLILNNPNQDFLLSKFVLSKLVFNILRLFWIFQTTKVPFCGYFN